jgi:hypothetical protein
MQKSESCLFHVLVVVEVAVAAGNFWIGCANISFSQNRVLGERARTGLYVGLVDDK